jgi:hexokinase
MCAHAGSNACYIEQLGAISKWLPHYRPRTPDMVVNIEWPGFRRARAGAQRSTNLQHACLFHSLV